MFIKNKNNGLAKIGLVKFSKTLKTITYGDKSFNRDPNGLKCNYIEKNTNEKYWISMCKRSDKNTSYDKKSPVYIDENIRERYWIAIRNEPSCVNIKVINEIQNKMETVTKYKHRENYELDIPFTEGFFEKAKQEAKYVLDNKDDEYFKNIFDNIDLKNTSDESFISGYILSKAVSFKKNNGIPPLPYPVSLSTIDVAAVCEHDGKVLLLLGRKPGQEKFQFPGGFRDPKETNVIAGSRELNEEANLSLDVLRFEYVNQLFIDDIRYRMSCHKITTTLIMVKTTYEEITSAKAGDDLEEVRVFDLAELSKDSSIVRDIHLKLLALLFKKLNRTKLEKLLDSLKRKLKIN